MMLLHIIIGGSMDVSKQEKAGQMFEQFLELWTEHYPGRSVSDCAVVVIAAEMLARSFLSVMFADGALDGTRAERKEMLHILWKDFVSKEAWILDGIRPPEIRLPLDKLAQNYFSPREKGVHTPGLERGLKKATGLFLTNSEDEGIGKAFDHMSVARLDLLRQEKCHTSAFQL